MTNKIEQQANYYYNQIEEEESEFEIEEEEEETITLDFDNQTIYSKEETIITGEEVVQEMKESIREELVSQRTYKDSLSDLLIDTLTSKAIASLIKQHHELETEIYDNVASKYKGMGKAIRMHTESMTESIDKRRRELRRSYGFSGRLSYEHIPEWSKPYIEDYIKGFITEVCSLIGDVE